ncbi:response regulator [Prolixibacter denitrificans]|uniref:DNA-binding NarL/FixJ family response regulator n=1 Tax=Prolixibacter denitrificans TaxID=1541063 RepID=A0A2P8CBR9_9BACT|nr:response regulator transcription factor [Prolixibacter denitrificans]PSK82418.1 DNA-binding NarL/FixJ family response regulator [Prolixibacter denitrificans]GET22840.1 DNA-binding response regulator [Prolixibacter denitrificans]
MKKLNIYLVDDHALFREGLRFLLSDMGAVDTIYEAENGEQFIRMLPEHPAGLVLLDIEMPEMGGIEAAQKALAIQPDLKIIALSMYSDENYYLSMIDAGAQGFLLKNSSFDEVKRAITEVAAGKTYFSAEILKSILQSMKSRKDESKDNELTEREAEILCQICNGLSNNEIGELLSISKRTVDKHRENLLQKTQSRNTANLVIYAIRHGYYNV